MRGGEPRHETGIRIRRHAWQNSGVSATALQLQHGRDTPALACVPLMDSLHAPVADGKKNVVGGLACQPPVEHSLAHFLVKSEGFQARSARPYAVNELPQPQALAACGFWKTNPWWISSST